MTPLIDSHCHLDGFGPDFDAVLARAGAAGVGLMVTISTRMSTFPKVLATAAASDRLYCTVGVHPHEAGEEGLSTPQALLEAAAHPKVIGIGESGLDYFYEHSPRAAQQRNFRIHIAAARESGLPLVVHTRDADDDTMDILEEEYARGPFRGLIHCFGSSADLARRAVAIGFYISCSGIITFPRAQNVRDALAGVPPDRLLVETDAPYLAPVPERGKPNEPSYIVYTARKLSEIKGLDMETIARTTTGNFFRLFTRADMARAHLDA